MSVLTILLIVAIGVAFYAISIYNTLQKLKTQIVASIQEIGNQLKRQASLIPNLESSVKSYLKHESGIFEMLTQARKAVANAEKSGDAGAIDDAISKVQSIVPQIRVAIEDNPELKANETVTKFMSELTDTADKLMYARRTVIDLSQSYNEKLVVFPSSIIAKAFGFKPEKGLATPQDGSHVTVSDDEMKDVKVNL